jgi:hypothetical protein
MKDDLFAMVVFSQDKKRTRIRYVWGRSRYPLPALAHRGQRIGNIDESGNTKITRFAALLIFFMFPRQFVAFGG